MIRTGLWAMAIVLAVPTASGAQTLPGGRLEIGGGVAWIGSASVGESDATESTASGGRSTLFKTSTTLGGDLSFRLSAGIQLTDAFAVEAQASFGRPTLRTTVSNDLENAAAVTAEESVKEYIIGGGVLWYVPVGRLPTRVKPFVAGQAAYLRQLHEMDTLVVTGQSYQVGGGIKYFLVLHRQSWVKGYGLRGDVAVAARVKGVFFDDSARFSPVVGGSLFVRF